MIPQANVDFLWNTVVTPRLATGYQWGTFDCSMAVSQELEALMYGPAMNYARQFSTMTFTGIQPGAKGPFAGIESTTDLICIDNPNHAPDDAAMIIAVLQGPTPDTSHMICRVPGNPTGTDIEMGGEANDYHTSKSNKTCASVYDTDEFNQWFYLPGPIAPGDGVTLFGTDVANVNFGGADNPNLDAVAAFVKALPGEGFSWLEFKATQGSDFTDPCWVTAYQTANSINFPIVAYHYLDGSSPASQAANAASVAGAANVGWMMDFEAGGGDYTNLLNVIAAFQAAGLAVVLRYAPKWFLDGLSDVPSDISSGAPLVSSAYPAGGGYASDIYDDAGGDDGEGFQPYYNGTPQIWQFTNQALIAGITVDADAFVGTLDQLLAIIVPSDVVPVAPPAPVSPQLQPLSLAQLQDQFNMISIMFQQLCGIVPELPILPGSPTPMPATWPASLKDVLGFSPVPASIEAPAAPAPARKRTPPRKAPAKRTTPPKKRTR